METTTPSSFGLNFGLSRQCKSSDEISASPAVEQLTEQVRMLEEKNAILLSVLNAIQRKLPVEFQQHVANTLIPQSAQRHTKEQNSQKIKPIISKREIEVLALIKSGLCAKEIAEKLFISETTVISHKKNLKAKIGARNTAELIHKTADWF